MQTVAGIVTALAQFYKFKLDDFSAKAYKRALGHLTVADVERAALECMNELRFMPKPVDLTERCGKYIADRQANTPSLPEPPVSEEQLRWTAVMAKSHAGWLRSGIIKKQRENNTFYSYEQSVVDYMTEQGVDEKDINRFRNACQDVKPTARERK